MEKRRPMRGKNSYLDDFHLNLAGEYIYEGAFYACGTKGAEQKQLRVRLWALSALALLSVLAGGFLPVPGMQGCAYVLLPYAAELLAAVSVIWAFGKLGRNWDSVREYTYERSVTVLPHRTALTAVFSLIGIVAESIYLLVSGAQGQMLFAVIYYALKFVAMVSALGIHRALARTNWAKVPKNGDE